MKCTHIVKLLNASSKKPAIPLIRDVTTSYLLNCFFFAVIFIGGISLAHAADDPYPEAHPAAGIQPKRPANYAPYQYPLSPQQLLEKYGPEMGKLAQQAWTDLEKTNAEGRYKNSPASLETHSCPEWFQDAKLGMFIDWGPWSVGGYAKPVGGAMYPDWYENMMYDTLKEYHAKTWGADIQNEDLINLLSDRRFDSREFARLAKECGFRYVVPFLKHHGGFCLWDSSFTRRDSVDWAFHRDFAKELSEACHAEGLKFGVYVSVGEWEYPAIRPDGSLGVFGFNGRLMNRPLAGCHFISGKIPVKDYVRDYFVPATKELLDKTRPDLLWWDGEWKNTSDYWCTTDLNAYFYNQAVLHDQTVCINDRSGIDTRPQSKGARKYTLDFITREFGYGSAHDNVVWEVCRSFSKNFGYNWTEESDAKAILDDKGCIDLVVDIIGRGGNLLLIVSPTGSGEIPPRQLHAIHNLGDWLQKYGEAIYSTRAYHLKQQPSWGRITHSKDGRKVYLHVTHWPANRRLQVPAIPVGAIERVSVMNGKGTPEFTQPNKDGFTVDLSACAPGDPRVSVVVITTK